MIVIARIGNFRGFETGTLILDSHESRLWVDSYFQFNYFTFGMFIAVCDRIDNRFFNRQLNVKQIATFPLIGFECRDNALDGRMADVERTGDLFVQTPAADWLRHSALRADCSLPSVRGAYRYLDK